MIAMIPNTIMQLFKKCWTAEILTKWATLSIDALTVAQQASCIQLQVIFLSLMRKSLRRHWVDFISRRMFPGMVYRHIVLTVPDFLRNWFYKNPQLLSVLMQTGKKAHHGSASFGRNQYLTRVIHRCPPREWPFPCSSERRAAVSNSLR